MVLMVLLKLSLWSSDSFKTIEGPIPSIGAFRDDSISIGWCSRVLAIKARPAKRH